MDPVSLPDPTHTPAAPPPHHGPYQQAPTEAFLAPARRTTMLRQALQGIELGAWDQRILTWLCHWSDTPTFLTILGWIERAGHTAGRQLADLAGEYELTKSHFSNYVAEAIDTERRLEQERDKARDVVRLLLRHLKQWTAPPAGLPAWISTDADGGRGTHVTGEGTAR